MLERDDVEAAGAAEAEDVGDAVEIQDSSDDTGDESASSNFEMEHGDNLDDAAINALAKEGGNGASQLLRR